MHSKEAALQNRDRHQEPEYREGTRIEPEPPRSKRCPSTPKANHPPPSRKKTCTHPNIRTTPRTHKTLDTQIDSAPPPPIDPPPHQQSALLEGESTCNEMVPTRQFRRPLHPSMHRRPPCGCRMPEHAPAQIPGDIPARTQASPAQPGPKPRGDMPQEPRAPKSIPDLPRSSPATRPVTYVRWYRLPKSIACRYQMPPPRGRGCLKTYIIQQKVSVLVNIKKVFIFPIHEDSFLSNT
ncbi:hypothetical protein AMECASPLE_021478 [Ameca splendens]|uniref:Uncharacterized protein n=1 Tax=Ameca splendens TaxID=208324 RepID=A0ABV0YR04_9TELE